MSSVRGVASQAASRPVEAEHHSGSETGNVNKNEAICVPYNHQSLTIWSPSFHSWTIRRLQSDCLHVQAAADWLQTVCPRQVAGALGTALQVVNREFCFVTGDPVSTSFYTYSLRGS